LGKVELERDIWLYYERIDGSMQKPELVFLHEGLGSTAMWKNFPQMLCQETGCPGLVYDRLGYGESSALQSIRDINYLHEYALQELPVILKSLIPKRPYIVIGHSDGGSIGLIWAAQQPPLLKALITEASHVFVEAETLAGIEKADIAYENGKLKVLRKYHGEKTHDIFKAWSETWLSNRFKDWNIENLLPSVSCPVFAIQGCNDQYGTVLQLNAISSQVSGPVQAMMVESCGHAPHTEQTEVVLAAMTDFINTLE